MAALTTVTERWIRERVRLKHPCLGDVRSLSLAATSEEKIGHLGKSLANFVRLKSLDLSFNALVSAQGVGHLKLLERLILYHNCIPSLEELHELHELPALRELDLRLNPLAQNRPDYRRHLVHAMPNLRRLDGCSVGDAERKDVALQFSSDLPPQPTNSAAAHQSSNHQRLTSIDRFTKRLSLPTAQLLSSSVHQETKESKDFIIEQRSSTPVQEAAKSILRYPPTKYDNAESKVPYVGEPSRKRSSASVKVAGRPKVSFDPYVEKHRPLSATQKHKDAPRQTRAVGHYTPNPDQSRPRSSSFSNIRPPSPRRPGLNLSDPTNPVLHPPRLTYSNKTEGGSGPPQHQHKKNRGSYRKPLEMLLNLVDKHWTGERSLHHNNNFLSQAVQILSMMENDISSREAEVKTLRREADALRVQASVGEQQKEEHKAEICNLSAELEEAQCAAGKLNEQLRIVLEENVALQKQLIRLERQYLKSMMRSSPLNQIREAQTEVEQLRKEIEGLREKVQDAERAKDLSDMLQRSHRSLVETDCVEGRM